MTFVPVRYTSLAEQDRRSRPPPQKQAQIPHRAQYLYVLAPGLDLALTGSAQIHASRRLSCGGAADDDPATVDDGSVGVPVIAAVAPELEMAATAEDRRSYLRVPADQLSWIREVRLKYGPRVSLVDVSDGGALVQTDVRLRPGAELVMEIVGSQVHAVPFRVLR